MFIATMLSFIVGAFIGFRTHQKDPPIDRWFFAFFFGVMFFSLALFGCLAFNEDISVVSDIP